MQCDRCFRENPDINASCLFCGAALNSGIKFVSPKEQIKAQRRKHITRIALKDVHTGGLWLVWLLIAAVTLLVPVLSINTVGYLLDWGVDAAQGSRVPLGPYKVSKRHFLAGLRTLVVFALGLIPIAAVAYLLHFVPAIGKLLALIAGIVLSVAFVGYFLVVAFRMSLFEDWRGTARDLKGSWKAFQRSPFEACTMAVAPGFVSGIVLLALSAVAVVPLLATGKLAELSTDGFVYSLGLGMCIAVAAVWLLLAALLAVLSLDITFRSAGHWTLCHAPKWSAAAVKRREALVPARPALRRHHAAEPDDSITPEVIAGWANRPRPANEQPRAEVLERRPVVLVAGEARRSISRFPFVIGTGPSVEVRVKAAEGISPRHARVHTFADGAYLLEDLEAPGGTFLNDELLGFGELAELSSGDVVRLGPAAFTILF